MPRKAIGKPNVEKGLKARVRARKALAGVLAGKTQVKACEDAGYSHSTALTQSTRILRRVKGELCEELERQGFGVKALASTLIAGAEAEMPVYSDTWEKNPNGEGFEKMRKVEMVPDPRTAALYTRQVIDVCGDAAATKIEHSGEIQLEVTADDILAARKEAEGKVAHGPGSNGNSSRLHGV